MSLVNFPVLVRCPHFEILVQDRRGWPEETDQRLYLSREVAEQRVDRVMLPGEFGGRVVEYEAAYYAWCVVCGDFPGSDEFIYADWLGVVQCIDASPGWSYTSEQLVFCPNHRPDKEN
ncbi:hypothetical protein AB0F91_46350 [Amycolatopsis sp. NPDC023774]